MWWIIIFLLLMILVIDKKYLRTKLMYFYGFVSSNLVKTQDFSNFDDVFIINYEKGAYMESLSLEIDFSGDGPIYKAYELGDGKQTGTFFVFKAIYPRNRKILTEDYYGEDPCRIIFLSEHGKFGERIQIAREEVPKENKSAPQNSQTKADKLFRNVIIKGNEIIPYNCYSSIFKISNPEGEILHSPLP